MQGEGLVTRVRRAISGAPDADEAVRLAVREIHHSSDRHDWTGVYLMDGGSELALSHFIGEPTPHARIPLDRGVCGAAARLKETIIVPDVSADSRYLACSVSTRSEIVVPIMKDGTVYGEIDIDSHTPDAFGLAHRRELEEVAALLAERLAEGRHVSWCDVSRVEDLAPGQCRSVRLGIRHIAVWNVGGTLYAHEDACKHMKAPLSNGRLNGTTLTCSWHGWKYDVTTGECHDKSWGRVRTFPVRVRDGVIQVSDVELRPPGEDDPSGEPEDEFPRPIFRS